LVPAHHSKTLITNHGLNFKDRKVERYVFRGEHNSFRDDALINVGVKFIRNNSRFNRLPTTPSTPDPLHNTKLVLNQIHHAQNKHKQSI